MPPTNGSRTMGSRPCPVRARIAAAGLNAARGCALPKAGERLTFDKGGNGRASLTRHCRVRIKT
jgi:hypothetical protein